MDDLSSRDDEKARELATEKERKAEQDRQRNEEKAREQATEKGRKEEQDRQKEREQATAKGRKQGLEEERAREKGKGGSGIKILLWIILLVIVILAVSLLTLSVTVTNVTPGNALPFTTNYGVSFPEGQTITIGNTHISVLSFENELISDIDGDRQKLVVGEDRVISERRAVITTLGAITLMDTNFEINLKYKGERDNRAYFDMAVHTSKQVPEILLNQLLPSEIDARPI
ncbi:MAG TPA: hypothetical protein VMV55_01980 [Methanoregula sp.]|nr:hypothetical protein [Methanoregula sp.]